MRKVLLNESEGIPFHIEAILVSIEELTKQLDTFDKEIRTIAKADAQAIQCMSVPGVGPVARINGGHVRVENTARSLSAPNKSRKI